MQRTSLKPVRKAPPSSPPSSTTRTPCRARRACCKPFARATAFARKLSDVKLTINGQPREVEGPVKLPDLLRTLGVNTQFVAVAINGEVLDKAAFPSIT